MCKYKDVNLGIKKFDFNVKLSEMRRAAMLLLVMMLTTMTAWAASTFSVENISGSTFRISRTGNTDVSETIDWRVVSLSAIAGVHFTGYQGNYSGTVTFKAKDTYVDVPITENTPGNNAYSYQNGPRSYRFEVLDRNGDILASCDRTITTGINVPSSGLFSEKEITIYTDPVQYSDAGYDQSKNPHSINSSSFYTLSGIAPMAYYTLIGAQLRSTLSIEAAEKNNGYQYVQILINNTNTCDNRSKCNDGDPGNMNISRYMAGFDHQPSSANTSYAKYTFPVTSQLNNCGTVDNAWNNGVPNKLYTQKFNTNCRATDGRLILPLDFSTLVVRFNASGGGTDHDEWNAKNVKAHIQTVDATAPTVLNNYKVSGGRHQKGNTIYVSVAFSEIVVVTGTPTLSSNWGTLSYTSGSGSNVLTFQGTIDPSDNNPFNVTGYSGTIKDLAGIQLNTASSTISHNFGTTLDADYVWSASDFNSLDGSSYEIYTTQDLRHLALLVNVSGNECRGLTFRQTHDITYTKTTAWNSSSSTENNYTAIGYQHKIFTNEAPFCGTFDGQGHTISGIRIYKVGDTSAEDNQGLFGYIGNSGTVRAVNLADARITGRNNVGGIAGKTYYATVEDCSVSADVCIHAVQNNSDYHGGIVGYSQGTVQRSLSRATLTVADNASGCGSYGAIVGMNDKHTVMDCIAVGATVPNVITAVSSTKPSVSSAGAIIGENISENKIGSSYVIQRNYYRACTVAGKENATGVGIGYDHSIGGSVPIDISANQSAQVLKYSLTLTSGVTLERSPSATLPGTGNATYTTGADIDGTPYAIPSTKKLHLDYSGEVPVGYHVVYSVNGTPIEGNSFTMPAKNVTVTATVTLLPVAYIDADGTEQSCTDYTLLTSNNDISNAMVQGNLPGGWYVVDGDFNTGNLQFSGDAHIILADGARLEADFGIYSYGYDLAIYGQAAGSGELSVRSSSGTSIYCNNICINGGTINIVSSNNYGIQANGNVTINGGTIYISGSHYSQINASNVILGTSTSLKTLNITNDIAVNTISLDRTFTKGKPATVMLPFSMDVNAISGGTFYTFGGVEKENDKWVATMNAVTGSIVANTPYLVMPTETSLTFNNGTHLCTNGGGGGQTADEGSHWTFKGTYDYIKWTTDTSDPDYNAERAAEIGSAYGFAGVAKDDIEVGDFVKVASGAKIRPMSCYLLWNNTPNAANARALSSSAAATDEELPSRITVRLVGADGEVTGIGEVDAQTGEMDFDSKAWYTLDGVRLSSKPSKKGLYINNGKRVVIK